MSLKLKLIILFLSVALIPLLFVSTLTFHNYKKSLETTCLSNLQNTAAFKADKIETYFAGLKDDIEIAQGFYNIKENLPVLIRLANDPNNPQAAASRKILQSQLQHMQSVSDMTDIMLINPEGKIVYANKPGHVFKDMSKGFDAEQKAFTEGKDRVYFSDAYFDSAEDNRFEMLVTAPASDFNGRFIGVIAFEVDMATIYKVIQEATGLGNTGEILVGKKTGSQIVYISPLRHEPQATLTKMITLGEKFGGPIQKAVQGKMGAGQSIDYRGQNVIAAWRYIPSLDWGLVAKIDTDEAFTEAIKLRNLALIILTMVIVLSSITAFSIARSIAEPIKKLSEGAAIIGSGNLDYRIELPLKDEVGQLSRAFDKMTRNLKQTTASRDELNREIAERKQAQESLVSAHRRLVLAQQSAGAGIWDWEIPSGKLDWSPELFRLFGLDPKEQPSFDLWQGVMHPQDCEQAQKRIEQSLQSRTSLDSEYRIFLPNGQIRWVNALGSAAYDENGKPQTMSGICIDITERKEIERALWDSQKRYSSVFHTSPAGIFVTRMTDGLFIEANESYLQIIGYSAEEIREHTSLELNIWVNQEDRKTITNLLRQQGRVDNNETLFRRKNGEIANILFSAVLFEQAGESCILGAMMDVTDRKKAEEALQKNEATLRGILDAAGESIWLFSADGFILTANQTALSRFGKSAEEIIGKHMNNILPMELAQLRMAKLEETVKSALPVDFEDQRGDMVFHHSFYPVKDSDGRVHSVVSFSRDITARLQAEESLRRSREDLNRAQAVANIGSWRLDVQRNELTWSDENHRIFGIPKGSPMTYETFLSTIHPDDLDFVDTKWKACLEGEDYDIEHRLVVDGKTKWVREKAYLEWDKQGALLGGFGITQDISDRKKKEEELYRLNRTLKALGNSNQAIMQVKDESEYLQEVCKIIVRDCGHAMVWIGFAEEDEDRTVRPVASAGFEKGYLQTLNITWADTQRGRGPTGTAIRTGKPSQCSNMQIDPAFEPWRQEAIKRGYASSIVFPLMEGGKAFGAITIYSKEPAPFSEDEVKLLTELATDLAYGIAAIRLRIEHARTEEAVLISEVRYRRLFEAARDGILILDADSGQIVNVNPFIKDMLGYSQEEFLDKKIWEIGLFKNIAATKEAFIELQNKDYIRYENLPFETKDGRRIAVEFVSNVYQVDRKRVFQCNIRDITDRIQAEESLRKSRDELELRVKERTHELAETVIVLKNEFRERVLAENTVKIERKRFFDVLETLPVYVVLLTEDYHVPFANRTFRERFGESDGKRCYEYLFNRPEPCEICETFKVLKTNQPQHWEWMGPDGRYYDIYDFPFTDTDGAHLIMEMGIDITEQKQAQGKQGVTNSLLELFVKKSLRKEYIDAVVEDIRNWSGCEFVGIRIKDNENNIPYESSVGFDDDFLAKENFLNLGHDNCTCMRTILEIPGPSATHSTTDGGSFYCNDSVQFSNGLSQQDKNEYRGNCIKCGFQSIAVIPIRYRDQVIGAIHITDLKKDMVSLSKIQFIETTIAPLVGEAVQRFNAEAELEKYRLNLEELVRQRTLELEKANCQLQSEATHRQQIAENLARSNKDLEQFAYVASHDLQEPLRAVAGFVDLLKRNLQGSLDDKTAEYMNFTVDGARRMQSLVNGLLEYSRVGAKGQKPQQTDSKAALDLAITHLLISIKESQAVVTADELPSVQVDSLQLTQLFQNLIGNAIKFHGQQPPQVHIRAARQDHAWQFAVADNGIGIEPQYAERIFLIFHRLHTRQKYPGTGIGLAICKKIIERHGGKIWVESKPEIGSTFYFTIPDRGETNNENEQLQS
jgi:PAS domain S-box-containing protein